MRRAIVIVVLFCLATGFVPTSIFAAGTPTSIPVFADTYVDASIGDNNNNSYYLLTSTAGVCSGTNNTATIYLRWDVSGWKNTQISTAEMNLGLYMNTNQGAGPVQLSLYKVADDTWDEAKMVYSNPPPVGMTAPPAVGDLIQTIALSDPNQQAGPVTFGSASETTSALADYIRTQKVEGDGLASFALNVTGCAGNDVGIIIVLYDKENVTMASAAANPSVAPNAGTIPTLTLAAPTAVTLSTFHAADSAVNWPVIAGLAALAALLVGVSVYRRRAAAR